MKFRSAFAAFLFAAAALPAFAQAPPVADVSVTKSGPALAAAGTDVAYTVTAINFGPDDASSVTLLDNIPSGMKFVSDLQTSGPTFSCTDPAPGDTVGGVNCTLATMTAGSSADFTITFHIPPATTPGTFFTNVASVSSPDDQNNENDEASATTQVPFASQSDAGVLKSGPSVSGPNTDVVYTITLSNGGPNDATDLAFSDPLPGTMTFVSFVQNSGPAISPPCSTPLPGSGGTIACNPASFAAGATAVFTLTGHIPAGTPSGTPFTNTASVKVTGDTNPDNDSATVTTTVSNVDLSVAKNGPATANAGTAITYTLSIANIGNDTATNVVLSDPLPAGTQFVSLTQNLGPTATCLTPAPGSNGTVICSYITLASGSTAQFSLVVNTGSAAPSITNTATITTDSFDTD
ncbi:MAG: hypothetical protein ACXVJT_14045, partial [Thermoanaerobaculia bacterium]